MQRQTLYLIDASRLLEKIKPELGLTNRKRIDALMEMCSKAAPSCAKDMLRVTPQQLKC